MTDMQTSRPGTRVRLGALFARLALAVGLISGAAALLAGPGYRLEWLSLGVGLQTVRWAATVVLVGLVIAVLALVLLMRSGSRRARSLAVAAIVLNAAVAGPPSYMFWRLQSLPRIHDVSTDTVDPPAFVVALAARKGAPNGVTYSPQTAAEQRRAYPDIVPLKLDVAPPEGFARAERAARAMGWQILSVAPGDLRIEATDTTLLFGFKDDIVIRVRPQPTGSVVDVRSESRVGGSDFGANAHRIRAFLSKMNGV